MKILLLADPASTHTRKWVSSLSERGVEVSIFGFNNFEDPLYKISNANLYSLNVDAQLRFKSETSLSKFTYLKAVGKIRKLIDDIRPDILHAHYASSYGFLGAMVNFKPYVISVWGSDVQSFPQNSFIHKRILKFSLNKSSIVLATSKFLADQAKHFTTKNVSVTPFGVNINKFIPIRVKKKFGETDIVIGTVKSLEKTYGVDKLIQAFGMVKNRHKDLPLKLLIVGGGSEYDNLKKLADEIVGENNYTFTGYIDYDKIQDYHNMIDVAVFLSNQEGFGVSILESMSCCKPVVVSKTGGLLEIVDDGLNGVFVSANNYHEAADAIEKLIMNPELRNQLGNQAREKVKTQFDWNKCTDLMLRIYEDLIKNEN